MPEAAGRLAAAFTRIERTRMQGLPFLNAALRVEAVGFRPWEGQWIGVLVTPWCMNVVLLPGEGEWTPLPPGGERFADLPAGRFRFIAGHDEELGEYHACSLFSPALEFADHEAARATAIAALEALFAAPETAAPADASGPARLPPSRRDFLRGRFSGQPDVDRG
jgi:[NiFe] hydrogenase assembly HybE family chaperone